MLSDQRSRHRASQVRIFDVVRGVCPKCRVGQITNGFFSIRRRCPECDYDFFPESGFYLGAMMVSYLLTAILTIPTLIGLKLGGAAVGTLLFVPFVQYLIIAPVLLYYSRIIWLHLEAVMTGRADGAASDRVNE